MSIFFLYTSTLFLNIHVLPSTPMVALNILMGMIMVMGVRLGLETIARSAEILIVVFFFLFLILVVFISPEIKFENIQPVYVAVSPYLSSPEGKVHFAGKHTALPHGWIQSAIESGIRVAHEINDLP